MRWNAPRRSPWSRYHFGRYEYFKHRHGSNNHKCWKRR